MVEMELGVETQLAEGVETQLVVEWGSGEDPGLIS